MRQSLGNLWNDTRGQDLIEYALLAALATAVSACVFPLLFASGGIFQSIQNIYDLIRTGLQAAGATGS